MKTPTRSSPVRNTHKDVQRFSERLNEEMINRVGGGWGCKAKFAEYLGIEKTTIGNYLNGKRLPDRELLQRILEKLNYASFTDFLENKPGYGAYDRRRMYLHDIRVSYETEGEEVPHPEEFAYVFKARADLSGGEGEMVPSESLEGLYAFKTSWVKSKGEPGAMVLHEVVGNSMAPDIKNGDWVLVDRSVQEPQNDRVMAVGIGNEISVKRVFLLPEGSIELRSDNEDQKRYPPRVYDPEQYRILGRVLWRCGDVF